MDMRREPPPFRRVRVAGREALSPHMMRVTVRGEELAGFRVDEPAASVRMLLPEPSGLVLPAWTGNEFLFADGRRPLIRTLTPRRVREGTLDVDIVLHDDSPLSRWALAGREAAVSGPGRGYEVDPAAPSFLLAGDESAMPAIAQLLEHLPGTAERRVVVELARPDAELPLGAPVEWCGDVVAAVRAVPIDPHTRVWAAGEAAAMQRLRKYLFEELGLPRAKAVVRGYWKRERRPRQQ